MRKSQAWEDLPGRRNSRCKDRNERGMFEATRGVSGKGIEAGGKTREETGLTIRVGLCEDLGFYPEVREARSGRIRFQGLCMGCGGSREEGAATSAESR